MSFKTSVALLIFFLDDLSIDVSGMLKVSYYYIIVLLSISPFMSVCICFRYLGAPVLGMSMLMCVISSYCIDPCIIISLSFIAAFALRSILSDISIATPAFLSFPFAWNIFFPSSHFQSVSFALKWSLVGSKSCRQQGFFLNPISHPTFFDRSR